MNDRTHELLLRNIREVFGESNATRRRAAIEELYAEDCVLYVPQGMPCIHPSAACCPRCGNADCSVGPGDVSVLSGSALAWRGSLSGDLAHPRLRRLVACQALHNDRSASGQCI